MNRKIMRKAKGLFFNTVKTFPVTSRGVVIGQLNKDSCVAACVRMLAADQGIDQPEAFLRELLQTDGGTFLSRVPAALQALGLQFAFTYRNDLELTELQSAVVDRGPALAYVTKPDEVMGHAVILDGITDEIVILRDPLPEGVGSAYQLQLSDFLKFWMVENSNYGCNYARLNLWLSTKLPNKLLRKRFDVFSKRPIFGEFMNLLHSA